LLFGLADLSFATEDHPMPSMIEARPVATRYGETDKTGTLRYLFGSVLSLAALFGLFILAGLEF
jgi:hypothetical protein